MSKNREDWCFERPEDMSIIGKLRLIVQPDGDVIVAICHSGLMIDIEFCAPGAGGGRSPETWKALRQLALAMQTDNKLHAIGDSDNLNDSEGKP